MPDVEPITLTTSPPEVTQPIGESALVQLHIAEYQALTTRGTYFITIMAGMFPLFVLYLAVVAQIIKPSNASLTETLVGLLRTPGGRRSAFFWGNFLVFQMMANVFEQLLLEQYGIVLYLESKVRVYLSKFVGQNDFWMYEKFQADSKRKLSRFGETSTLLVVSLSLGLLIFQMPHFQVWDYAGLIANLGSWTWLVLNTVNVVRTRREWEKHG